MVSTPKRQGGSGMPTEEMSTCEIVVLRSRNHCLSMLFLEPPLSFSVILLSKASVDAQDGNSQYSRCARSQVY